MNRLLLSFANATSLREKALYREELAALVRAFLIANLRRGGLQQADAEDLVDDNILRILDALLANPTMANPEAYLSRVGSRLVIDLHRHRRSRNYQTPVDIEEHAVGSRLVERERVEDMADHALLRCLEQILERPDAPANYVCLLEAHYFWAVPLEVVTAHELWGRGTQPPGTAAEQKKARNAVDQRLTRARRWLQEIAKDCCSEALS